ncbi:hypothetical protein E1091_05155 [Micromonospora fluostatini]|uniref:Uncharacterized protein n=1 Tax=Micromonospora fluostatini TaxID=1629071 RepID=A0ABY2DK82_9ACTN|nr:hypothetical protein E1091_05155 [Micromonospora fluostatini]
MERGRFGDVVVGTAGDVAGGVVDPKAALGKVRATTGPRTLLALAAGLALGYLLARSRLRA